MNMAQEFLNVANVATLFKRVRRETVPQAMWRCFLFDASDLNGALHFSLDGSR
jgi:hypothetical protein